jgi:hypothetical protein
VVDRPIQVLLGVRQHPSADHRVLFRLPPKQALVSCSIRRLGRHTRYLHEDRLQLRLVEHDPPQQARGQAVEGALVVRPVGSLPRSELVEELVVPPMPASAKMP